MVVFGALRHFAGGTSSVNGATFAGGLLRQLRREAAARVWPASPRGQGPVGRAAVRAALAPQGEQQLSCAGPQLLALGAPAGEVLRGAGDEPLPAPVCLCDGG